VITKKERNNRNDQAFDMKKGWPPLPVFNALSFFVSFPLVLRNRVLILRNCTLRRFGWVCSACPACSPCSDCTTCSGLLLGFPVT
jgi:hypothetical protein